MREAFARTGLPGPTLTSYTVVSAGDSTGRLPAEIGLFATDGALANVDVLHRTPGAGVFLPDTYAAQLGVTAGDQLPTVAGALPIAGIYRDLDDAGYRTVLPGFWCHWRSLIVTSVSSQPPPFVLADAATVDARVVS